jgi:hypothetical protein
MAEKERSGEPIPLRPLTGLGSLDATATLAVDGMIGGRPAQGQLTADLTLNGKRSRVTVSGSLLGEVAAQIGGALVGLFTPASLDLFKVPEGVFVSLGGFLPICVKPESSSAASLLQQISPETLLAMLTRSDVAVGRYAGDVTVNGRPARHYVIDGDAFLAAARSSADPQLRKFGEALSKAGDADVFVDQQGGYPVAFRGSYGGTFEPLGFSGSFALEMQLTGVNRGTPVELPSGCANARVV